MALTLHSCVHVAFVFVLCLVFMYVCIHVYLCACVCMSVFDEVLCVLAYENMMGGVL